MKSYRGTRELRALDRIISIAYYLAWVVSVLLLLGLPAVRLWADRIWAGDVVDASFVIHVPAAVAESDTSHLTHPNTWAGGYALHNMRGDIAVPIATAPMTFLVLTWIALAVGCGLSLLIFYHARALVRRARDGAPFDAGNAVILRRLGQLLLVRYILKAIYLFGAASWAVRQMSEGGVKLTTGQYANWSALFLALVLMALAGIFRRGAALEDEQSLVV
jgi:hypothetical protein